jgi:hypothetical protein
MGPEWEGMTGGAIWEDLKADVKFEVFHAPSGIESQSSPISTGYAA